MSIFEIRFLKDENELDAIYKLRYEIFNMELNEGLESSHAKQKDIEDYDSYCDHLIAIDTRVNRIIGTYRLQSNKIAKENKGFCTEKLFKVNDLGEDVLNQSLELSRACIHKDYRNGRVLHLMWKTLVAHMVSIDKKFLFGSCSFPGTSEANARRMYSYIKDQNYYHSKHFIKTIEEHRVSSLIHTPKPDYVPDDITPLFIAYMKVGCKVCSEVAIDFKFNTYDFIILLNIDELDKKTRKIYVGE